MDAEARPSLGLVLVDADGVNVFGGVMLGAGVLCVLAGVLRIALRLLRCQRL